MGKKCVQLVRSARKKVCIVLTSPQQHHIILMHVGKSCIQSKTIPVVIHRVFTELTICYHTWLYTVSTMPITTTICLKNYKTITPTV